MVGVLTPFRLGDEFAPDEREILTATGVWMADVIAVERGGGRPGIFMVADVLGDYRAGLPSQDAALAWAEAHRYELFTVSEGGRIVSYGELDGEWKE